MQPGEFFNVYNCIVDIVTKLRTLFSVRYLFVFWLSLADNTTFKNSLPKEKPFLHSEAYL